MLPGPSWRVPAAMTALYQAYLSLFGGQEYIETGSRQCASLFSWHAVLPGGCNWWTANREGWMGCWSYIALYLWSEWIGSHVLYGTVAGARGKSAHNKVSPQHRTRPILNRHLGRGPLILSSCFGLWWMLISVLHIPVSRRSTNAPFLVWVMILSLSTLLAIQAVQLVASQVRAKSDDSGTTSNPNQLQASHTLPPCMSALNRYGLVVFIGANLLTGVVNLSMNTLKTSPWTARLVLSLYLATIMYAPLMLERVMDRRKSANDKKTM
jgi:glucosaminylphosphatidylinositol acyltransferase